MFNEAILDFRRGGLAYLYHGAAWHLFLISVPVTVSLFLIDAWYVGWQRSALRRLITRPSRSARFDLAFCFLYVTNLSYFLGVLLSFGLSAFIPAEVKRYLGYDLFPSITPPLLRYSLYLFFYDFLTYWVHRLQHYCQSLWEIHKIHHSATEFNIITAHRVHPFENVHFTILTCIPLALVGAPPEFYVFLRIFKGIHESLQHSMLPWDWGWVGQYLLISPIGHRIHHSTLPEHLDKNFAEIFPVLDRMFGTWYSGNHINKSVSVGDNIYNRKHWYVELWESYVRFFVTLFRISIRA